MTKTLKTISRNGNSVRLTRKDDTYSVTTRLGKEIFNKHEYTDYNEAISFFNTMKNWIR